jgi:hypothetical protein
VLVLVLLLVVVLLVLVVVVVVLLLLLLLLLLLRVVIQLLQLVDATLPFPSRPAGGEPAVSRGRSSPSEIAEIRSNRRCIDGEGSSQPQVAAR